MCDRCTPEPGTMQDIQMTVFIADHRRRKARRMLARGLGQNAARQLELSEQMFISAAERFLHNSDFGPDYRDRGEGV